MTGLILLLEGINPEPWAAPDIFRGRGVKNADLRAFQNAVNELVSLELHRREMRVPVFPKATPLVVCFGFWRQQATSRSSSGRNVRSRAADATNMQKATEDALQKLIFDNDRHNLTVASHVIEQGDEVEPAVLVFIEPTLTCLRIPSAFECAAWREEGQKELRSGKSTVWIKEIGQ